MLAALKTKLALALIGGIAVLGITGTTVVVAAQQHAGPFAPGGMFAHATPASAQSEAHKAQDQSPYHAQGLIHSVSLDAKTHTGTLVFIPDGTSKSVTVRVTVQTHVEVADAPEHDGMHGQARVADLTSGLFAVVVGTLQHDGSVLAKNIQANAHGKAHHGGEMPTPGAGNGHPDPTPTPKHGTLSFATRW